MELRDPMGDTALDFLSENWEGPRDAIIQGGKSVEEAIKILERGWQAQHEKDIWAWNKHLECLRDSDNGRGGVGGQEQATLDNGQDSGAPEWLNNPTPSFLDI